MSSYVDTKIVCLTSQSATIKFNGGFLSNVRYNLGTILRNDADILHRQVQLLNAQIPYSFYVINYTNNLFRTNLLGTATTYTIPTGNYTANSLITSLQTVLGNPTGLVISVSPIDGRITFTYTSNFIIYNNITYSIGYVLGFPDSTTYSSTANVLTSTNPLNLLGIKTLQIRSANLIMNNISSVQGGSTTLLQSIPVSCVPFGMIDYTDKGNMITIHNDYLDDIDLEIIDGESSNYINFNGQDWCITLAFHITRKIIPPSEPTRGIVELPTKQNPTISNEPKTLVEKPKNPDLEQLNILSE